MDHTINISLLKKALGQFATGVTIITTLTPEGTPLGMTVSSFSSVSLEPPLILWSLQRSSQSLEIFQNTRYFAVNILAENQPHLSDRFSCSPKEKFEGIDIITSDNGTPIFKNCLTYFECVTKNQFDGGDHIIFIGEIIQFTENIEGHLSPLIHYDGNYRTLK